MPKDPYDLSARAAALLKEEEGLRERVDKIVDDFISWSRSHGVPKRVFLACEFGRYNGRLVGIL
jgi:hypothetical protein